MADELQYKGYTLRLEAHPTPMNHSRMAYDIYDGDKCRKANISGVELAKKYIDVMIRYGYWTNLAKIG